MHHWITLETDYLLLRPWQPDDLPDFARLNADPEVMACFPAPLNRVRSDELAQRLADELLQRGWGIWALELKQEQRFIGFTGIQPSSDFPFPDSVEIGWRLARDCWGRGLASEAARAALEYGFGSLQLPEIIAFTSVRNTRSRRLMERLGMRDSAENFLHPRLDPASPLAEHALYRLSRAQFEQSNQG